MRPPEPLTRWRNKVNEHGEIVSVQDPAGEWVQAFTLDVREEKYRRRIARLESENNRLNDMAIDQAPTEVTRTIHVLWAKNDRYETPYFVAAFSDSLHDAYPESFDEVRAGAEDWFSRFGDEPASSWRFWTTEQTLPLPTVPSSFDDDEPDGGS